MIIIMPVAKKHRVNAAFRKAVDELEDMCGYVLRGDSGRALEKKSIVEQHIKIIANCITYKIEPAKPMYWDYNGVGTKTLMCGHCTEDDAVYEKKREYADNEEPTHLCDGCIDYIPDEFKIWNEGTGEYEQDPNGIDVKHYTKMKN